MSAGAPGTIKAQTNGKPHTTECNNCACPEIEN